MDPRLQFLDPQAMVDYSGVGEGDRVADLGAGSGGYFTIPMAHAVGYTGKVYAVDLNREALATIEFAKKQENLLQIETIWADIEKPNATGIRAASLDYVFLKNVLFQNTHHDAILAEAFRLLKKGGVLVIVDWRQNDENLGPDFSQLINREELFALATKQGFARVDEGQVGGYHFFHIYRKQ